MRYSLPGFSLTLAGLGLVLAGFTQAVSSSTVAITKPVVTLPPPPAPKAQLGPEGRLADEHRMKFHAAVTRSRNWR